MRMRPDETALPLLDGTEEGFRQAGELSESMKQRLQGEIEVIRGNLAFNDLEPTVHHYREAVRLLNGPSLFSGKSANWNFGSPSLTFVGLRKSGAYGELPEQGAEFLREYNILSGGKTQGAEKLLRAEYLLVHGDFSAAEPLFTDALHVCGDNDSRLMTALIAAFGLSRLLVANGDAEKALSMLAALRSRAEKRDLYEIFDAFDIAQGYINAVLGRCDAIPRWLRDGEMSDPPHNMSPYIFGICVAIHGKALLLRGEYPRLAAAARNLPDAAPLESIFARMHGKILEAIAAWHTQGQREALKLLREALDLSRPDGLVLLVAEYGGAVLPLLRRLKRDGESDGHLEAVLALAGTIARTDESKGRQKSVLTPREQEILRHVADGETNPVIAGKLHISVNAVKHTLAKACVKLGAFSRLDAAQRFARLSDKG
jgi:LuxR family maltose regulon positive regulatory protein